MKHMKYTTGGGASSKEHLRRPETGNRPISAKIKKRLAGLGALVVGAAFVTAAAFGFRTVASALETAADAQTMSDYSWSLGNKSSTQYNGRVWTDKSVSTEDVKFTGDAGETVTVPIGEGNDASDFLVTYSALATSQQVSGESNVPVDVVFVIDLSGSMSNSDSFMDNGQRRIQNLVTALNTAVNELMEMNPDNRIGVVGYESTAMTILPLDHYTPSGYNQNIFSYSDRYNRLSWDARNSSNQRVNDNTDVSGGTNTQMGIYQGMNMLATEADTTVTLEGGQEVSRVPSVIVMADGAATFSSDSSSWWSPSNNSNDGPGNGAYYGNGMKAMMTAAYMKQAIDRNYHPTDDAYKTTVYTIGIGTDDLSGDSRDLAYITLNPKDHWNDNNNMANSIRDKWNGVDSEWGEWFDEEGYLSNNGTGTPNIDVDRRETYELTHPRQYDITEVGLQYNDAYYDAITAEDINTIFADIVDSISLGTPQVPTKVEGGNPVESGYITYTDVIGDYMEVDSVKTLLWAGKEFTNPQVSGEGTTDVTYTFSGEIQNPAYENAQNANQIQITVHTDTAADGTKTQTLTVKIPATAIPLRVNTVELSENAQGETTVVSNTSNNAYPLRLVYGVSLQDGIDPTTLEGVSDAYIADNTENGKVNFYSNKYSGNAVEGKTVGDAKVEFTPADNNPFYFLQENTPIYTSQTGNDRVTRDNFNENATYWVPVTYYDGNQTVNTRVAREASTMTGYIGYEEVGSGWQTNEYAYIRAGAPRLGNLTDVVRNKGTNTTNTAETSLYPTFEGDDVHNGKFVVYLGNNGKLQLDAPASLIIAKDVTADEGLTAPDATFTFEVTSEAKADSTVSATITTGSGQTATTEDTMVQFNADGVATVTLKADQSIELKGMAGADYSIKETRLPSGFDFVKVEGADETSGSGNDTVATGTVQTGAEDEMVTFTNNYSVESVTSEDLNIDLGGTKTITGRSFQEDDTFTFTIAAGRLTPNAPLPSATEGGEDFVTITPNNGDSATFEFDPITFTEPGEYCYIIRETDPTAGGTTPEAGLGGVDYDTAVYRISVVIVDNGDGTLRLATTDEIAGMETQVENYTNNPMIQVLEGTGMTGDEAIQFDNSYNSESTTATIQGMKVLNVLNSDYRLQDGDFTFKIEALGSNTDGGDQFTTDETQPMPVDQNGDELTQTTNVANGNVRFDFAEDVFTQDMVGKTFGYKITEVNPSPEGSIMSNGVTYDTSEKTVKITVADDGQGNVIAQVTPNTADEGDPAVNFTFTNSYKPEEVTIGDQTNAGITVQKTFTGHEWTDDYSFEYTLKAVSNTAGIDTGKMPMPVKNTLSITNPVSGSVNKNAFGEMTFERAGEYVYKITETNDGHGGVTYDDHTATVKVVVSENEETGRLSAAIQYDNSTASEADKNVEDAAAFTNTYDATFDTDTAVNLDGTKNLTVGGNSSRTLGAGQFYAVVAALDGAPLGDAAVAPGTTTYNIANTADDSADNGVFTGSFEDLLNNITFELSDLKGAASRDFVYLISEQQGNATGVKYDQSVYQVTVSVTDDGKGTLSADEPQIVKGTMQDGQFVANESQDGVNGVVFNNSYKPTSTTYAPLKITKVLSGDRNTGLQQGEFSFEMSVTSADPQDGITLPQQTVVENSADGSVQFGNITFTKAGTYVVQVKEVVPAEDSDERVPGVTYDEHVISRTFTVGDVDGELVVRVTNSTGSTTFTNTYSTTGDLVGSADLVVTKNFTGRWYNEWLESDSFSFTLKPNMDDEATKQAWDAKQITLAGGGDSMSVTIDDETTDYKKAFGDITFDEPGTYKFNIAENVNPEATNENVENGNVKYSEASDEQKAESGWTYKGVTYDNEVRSITVEVKDNGDGTMTARVTEGADTLTFTNTYKPGGDVTVGDGKTDIELSKILSGKEWSDKDEFTFTIAASEETPDAPMPETTKVTLASDDAAKQNDETYKADFGFGPINYKAEGVYKYVVSETEGDNEGIDYADNKVIVVVTVTDNLQGGYSAAVTYENGQSFTNTYAAELDYNAEGGLNIQKTLVDHDIEGGQFAFTVTGTNAAAKALLGGDGTKVVSTKGATMGDDGNAVESIALFDDMVFKHTDDTSTDPEYTFTVKETTGGDEAAGYTNDDTKYTVTIDVIDDGEGKLTVKTHIKGGSVDETYSYDNTDAEHGTAIIPFTNTYEAKGTLGASGKVSLSATKVTNGRDMTEAEYDFKVTATSDVDQSVKEYAMGTNASAADGVAGAVTFSDINFTKESLNEDASAGYAEYAKEDGKDTYTYNYTVAEVTDDLAGEGITATTSSFSVPVKVTDNNDGTLTVEITYPQGSGDTLAFVNTYQTNEVPLTISGAKKIDANGWADAPTLADIDGKYEFTISGVDEDGNDAPLPDNEVAYNDASGSVTFGEIVYTLENVFSDDPDQTQTITDEAIDGTVDENEGIETYAGVERSVTYTYTIEESQKVDGIDNDSAQTFTVTVTDNGKGELTVSTDPSASSLFTFTNTYNVPEKSSSPTDGSLTLGKTLTGRDMNDGEFSFEMIGTSENAKGMTATGTNTAAADGQAGTVSLSPITFKAPGTYEFQIGEVEGDLGGVDYDTAKLTAKAEVTSDGQGNMVIDWSVYNADGDEVTEFTYGNSYTAEPTEITLGAVKVLDGRSLEEGEFTFQLKGENGQVISEANNAADGSIQFDTIAYDKTGTYQYTVSEVEGNDETITYDDADYTITVEVTDDLKGHLSAKVAGDTGAPVFTNTYEEPVEPVTPVEPEKPEIPQTSDTADPIIPAALAAGGAALVAGAAIWTRRRSR